MEMKEAKELDFDEICAAVDDLSKENQRVLFNKLADMLLPDREAKSWKMLMRGSELNEKIMANHGKNYLS